jgi:hypothetical protein
MSTRTTAAVFADIWRETWYYPMALKQYNVQYTPELLVFSTAKQPRW